MWGTPGAPGLLAYARFFGGGRRAFDRLKFEGAWCGAGATRAGAYDGSVTCGTRFSVVPDKQVFKEGIDAFVLQAIQFRIFVE